MCTPIQMGDKCVLHTLGNCDWPNLRAYLIKYLEFGDFAHEIFLYPLLIQSHIWDLWNDGLTTVNPEWLKDLPGSFRWNGVPGQTLTCKMKGTANFAIAPFIPAGTFVRGKPCNLYILMCSVLCCSEIGKIPVHRKNESSLYTKDTSALCLE